ncbi:MAG TPA: hypothetical protein VF412_01290 [Bdellovibrio sp.]|uniref:hypothetical protein n=1 Tax=Bdellovibrio sp. TaxID=28201 RepID=UPI002EE9DB40
MEKLRQLKFDTKLLLISFLGFGVLSFILTFSKGTPPAPVPKEDAPSSVDTFIPKGFVLVPLELANAESLGSLVSDVGGVVDLYLANKDGHKSGLKIASRIKLLRAPLNPQQYAVLVKENESSRLLSMTGPFIAVVQNPDSKGTEVAQSKKTSIKIDYQN